MKALTQEKALVGTFSVIVNLRLKLYNKVSTRDYVDRLAQAMNTTPEKIEAAPEPSFILGLKRFVWDSLWIPLSRRGTYNILV